MQLLSSLPSTFIRHQQHYVFKGCNACITCLLPSPYYVTSVLVFYACEPFFKEVGVLTADHVFITLDTGTLLFAEQG